MNAKKCRFSADAVAVAAVVLISTAASARDLAGATLPDTLWESWGHRASIGVWCSPRL